MAAIELTEQEKAVEAIKATLPPPTNREELRKDPIYRIMHALPRSDVLEVVRSRFAAPHCARAAAYFDMSYTKNPLRHLRLQLGCDGPTGLHLFFSRMAMHCHTLRVVDLSRNRLCADDVVQLCNLLGLGRAGDVAAAAVPLPAVHNTERETGEGDRGVSAAPSSSLELLDLSYNTAIRNSGALHVLAALQHCPTIRAVMLRSVGIDDDGAAAVADLLHRWPVPRRHANADAAAAFLRPATASATKFFANLNENYIGARGTQVLGKAVPSHVSLTVIKQRLDPALSRKRARGEK